MPNWCDNSLTLTHDDPAMIKRAVRAFGNSAFLNEFIPCPKELSDTTSGSYGDKEEQALLMAKQESNIKNYGYSTWYDFAIGEWGTKWDVGCGDGYINDIDGGLILSFESAWAPPTTAYAKLEELGFKILAMYYEPGMAFAGVYEDGTDDYYEYGGLDSAGIAETLPSALDEAFGISESVAEWEAENAEDEENIDIDLDGGLSATNE
jgi:hypothetical protein